jgi:hypothetical protein
MPGPFIIIGIALVSRAFSFARRRQWDQFALASVGALGCLGVILVWMP